MTDAELQAIREWLRVEKIVIDNDRALGERIGSAEGAEHVEALLAEVERLRASSPQSTDSPPRPETHPAAGSAPTGSGL